MTDVAAALDILDEAIELEPNVLYRFFAADQTLLYVGITKDLGTRLKSHNRSKDWFREVAYVRLEHFDSRDDVEEAERAAIRVERPLWNINYRTSLNAVATLDEVVAAWDAIGIAVERYREVLRTNLAAGVQQSEIAAALGRTREALRQDAMTPDEREAVRKADAERKRKNRSESVLSAN